MNKNFHYILYILLLFLGVRMLNGNPSPYFDKGKKKQHSIPPDDLKEGDIIFQSSKSGQSLAVQLATHSKYSHCGILFKDTSGFYVLEAVQPVKRTRLDKWVTHGDGGHYTVRRLKTSAQTLTPAVLTKMKGIGSAFIGKNYDLYFGWSDDLIYCSELVWKVYQRGAGLEVGKLQKLKDFDLSSDIVKKKLKERYGKEVPLEEKVISPGAVFDSDLLETVKEN
ncbi:MAG: YiiX family permuted papain-like enzyme [Bacteroidia bacterium]